jgi:O-antigen/teichoic acid export membrane protein
MTSARTSLTERLGAVRSDRLLVNSTLMFTTTLMMAAGGALFWVVAARVQTPENVGLAGSLVAAADAIALFAQLGLNITLLRTMPTSERRAADVATASLLVVTAGSAFALVYCLALPVASPTLHSVLDSPTRIAIFCVLVAATALNVLTDSVFLAINRVRSYLWLNGVLLGVTKCALPILLAGAGALGLYGSAGGAALVCGVASVLVIFRHVPGRRSLSPSRQLVSARRFAGAGYATYVLNVVPQLVIPLIIINSLGAARGAVFFLSSQIVMLQNAVILAVGNSMYAESQREPHRRLDVVRRGGVAMGVVALAGALVVLVMAPYFLQIFGAHYVHEGTATLRVLSLSVLALGFNYWSAMRLRIAHRLRAMIGVQLTSTIVVLALAWLAASHGTVWVALAWGVGQLIGGTVGYVASRTGDALHDEAPRLAQPADAQPAREMR